MILLSDLRGHRGESLESGARRRRRTSEPAAVAVGSPRDGRDEHLELRSAPCAHLLAARAGIRREPASWLAAGESATGRESPPVKGAPG